MNDAIYSVKVWLTRADELENKRKKQVYHVALIASKLNRCVSSYESSGIGHDLTSAQAKHEDLLADYVTACQQLENITAIVLHEDILTIRVINRLNNIMHQALLLDIHVNRLTLNEISKSGKYELKKRQLYNHYQQALQELAAIRENNNEILLINPKNKELETLSQPLA